MAWEWGRLCRGGDLAGPAIVLVAVVAGGRVAAAALASVGLALGTASSVRAGPVGGAQDAGARAAMDRLRRALGRAALRLSLVAGARRADRPRHIAVDAGGRLGHRYRRLRRRPDLGGPRLAPRWSPRKTWAGLAGGMVCAALTGWATAGIARHLPGVYRWCCSARDLRLSSSSAILPSSVAKRRFGVKDSSGLIPGHGGLLDRLDGLLAVIPVVALLTLIGGRSVLAWR